MKKEILDLKLIKNKKLSNLLFIITLKSTKTLPNIKAGQFAEIEISNNKNVFLRRPFSITDVNYPQKEISFLIKRVGKGTNSIWNLEEGSKLNVIFPLGKGYNIEQEKNVLLIGGGSGIASIFFLAKEINNANVLLGGRTAEDIVLINELKKHSNIFISTQDGSIGEKGLSTQNSIMKREELMKFDKIYCCGPDPMMKAVAKKAKELKIDCEVSLENTMACGIGVCLCCVTDTKEGHKCVCIDGPVFNSKELKW